MALRFNHKDAKTRRGFWSKEFSMGTRIAACGFGLFFVLGCCSATRPGGAQSNSRGAEALRSGDYDKARAHFEDALKSRAEDEASQAGLLQVLRETGQYREALKRGIEFLKARENSAKLQLEMGRSFKAAGDLGGAEQHLRRATQLGGPARLDSVRELGFLLEETGRRSEAEGLWQRTVEEYRKGAVGGSQEENYEEAIREVRRALAVNPSDLEALSLEAVYHQFRGDQAAFTQAERRVLEIHPSFGRLYFTIAENLANRRKYAEAIEFNRKALNLDPKLWAAWASLGMNLMRVGELSEGRRAVQKAFEGDPYNVWAFNTLDLLDQMDKFVEVRSEHFLLRLAKEDEPVLSVYAPKLAEEVFAKLSQKYGFTPAGPLQVEIFPDHGGFAVRTLGLPGLGALGVCFGKVIALDSPRARKPGSFNWGSTLWHEFAHVITLQMTRHNIPRWFSEGISVYEERRARPGWGDDLNAHFVKAYKEGKILKVSELNSGMMRPKFPEQVALSYYQASLVCELIEEKFGFGKIRESLALFAEGLPTVEVFRRSLGWDAATLDAEYARYVDVRLREVASHLDFQRHAEVDESSRTKEVLKGVLERNPDDFFANLQLGGILKKEKANGAAEVYLKKAQALFPEYVEPGNPYQVLADIYLEEKRPDEALTQLLGWSRYDENALAPLMRAAEIYRERKDWENEARMLQLSVYIHPYDPAAHTMLGEASMESRDWATAVAAYKVLVGLNPADLAGAHFNLARAWSESGRKQEAKKETLRALEIAPTFEKAQQLLLKLTGSEP